jgi:hypothetical protein
MAAGDHERIAGARQVLLDAAKQQRVERALEVLRDQSDRARSTVDQRLGDAVEDEAQTRPPPPSPPLRLSSLTLVASFMTRDAVETDTPAASATIRRVT